MSKAGEVMATVGGNIEREHSNEVIEIDTDTLIAIDLDRTLVDSDRLVDITLLSLEDSFELSQDSDAIAALEIIRIKERQERGNSFAYLEALQQEIGSSDGKWVDGLAAQVIDANRDDQAAIKLSFINQIMLPGALDLLREVESLGVDWIIMTAGQQLTQQYKLTLVRQILAELGPSSSRLSYLITDPDHQHSKAEMINLSFVGDAGARRLDLELLSKYSTEAGLADHVAKRGYAKVVLLDDKLANLESVGDVNPQLVTELVKTNNDDSRPGRSLTEIRGSLQASS